MKPRLIIFFCLLASCNRTFIGSRYVFIDEKKESEIELIFKSDSTFLLTDRYGCRRLNQQGTVSKTEGGNKKKYRLTDTTRYHIFINQFNDTFYSFESNVDGIIYSVKKEYLYPVITCDTVLVLNSKTLIFRGETFRIMKGNLENIRVLRIEKKVIEKIGEKNYVNTVGEGRSIKKARENIKRCGDKSIY